MAGNPPSISLWTRFLGRFFEERPEIDFQCIRDPNEGVEIRNPKPPFDVADALLGEARSPCKDGHRQTLAFPFLPEECRDL